LFLAAAIESCDTPFVARHGGICRGHALTRRKIQLAPGPALGTHQVIVRCDNNLITEIEIGAGV
jgi:hypothetical protein